MVSTGEWRYVERSAAIALIERFAPERKKIALFLGIHPTTKVWSVHTNAVLLLTGRGHRWPISYVLSDELNPLLQRKITGSDVQLDDGEVVFIRKDEKQLGALEAAIVEKIRAQSRLCPLTPSGTMVIAYKVSTRDCN